MQPKDVPIRDEFDNSQGRFVGYATYDSLQQAAIDAQAHIDIRNFRTDVAATKLTMFDFDWFPMSDLDNNDMAQLEQEIILTPKEPWTAGAVDRQSDRNQWTAITLTCLAGATTRTESVLKEPR